MDIGVLIAAVRLAIDRSSQRTLDALQTIPGQATAAKRTRILHTVNARVAAMPTRPTTQHIRYASRGAHRHR